MIALSFGDDLFPEKFEKKRTHTQLCVVSTCWFSCIISALFVFSFFLFYRLSVYRFLCVRVEVFQRLLTLVYSSIQNSIEHQQPTKKKKKQSQKQSNSNQCHLSCDVIHFVALQTFHCNVHKHTHKRHIYLLKRRKKDCCCCRHYYIAFHVNMHDRLQRYYANTMWCRFKFNFILFVAILHVIISSLVPL